MTKIKEGYTIENFSMQPIAPDDTFHGSEIMCLLEDDACPHLTILPFPPNKNSPNGWAILFASPYPITVDEAKELYVEYRKHRENERSN